MAGFSERLREYTSERLQPGTRWAVVAPMPLDLNQCRWCGGRLRAIVDGQAASYCDSGCANNLSAPYLGHCPECGKEFETGKQGATLCHPCDHAEAKRFAENGAVHPYGSYRFELFGRGGYR